MRWHCFCSSSSFLSVFFPASIVTVIRLVNDAVDNIESEGIKEYILLTLLSLLSLPTCLLVGVALRYNVVNAAKPLLLNPLINPLLLRIKHLLLRFLIFLSLYDTGSFCVSIFLLWFLCCLSQSVSDFCFLSRFVVSNMDKEQRRNSPGEWDAKQLKNIVLTCHPFGFITQAVIPKLNLL